MSMRCCVILRSRVSTWNSGSRATGARCSRSGGRGPRGARASRRGDLRRRVHAARAVFLARDRGRIDPGLARRAGILAQSGRHAVHVRQRPVRARQAAAPCRRLGYQDVLFQARQPAYVVYIELDPRRVDVNAHPAKLEIRFRDSKLVHDFVFRTVEAALASTLEGVANVRRPRPFTAPSSRVRRRATPLRCSRVTSR